MNMATEGVYSIYVQGREGDMTCTINFDIDEMRFSMICIKVCGVIGNIYLLLTTLLLTLLLQSRFLPTTQSILCTLSALRKSVFYNPIFALILVQP